MTVWNVRKIHPNLRSTKYPGVVDFREQGKQRLRKFQDLPNSLNPIQSMYEILEGLNWLELKEGTDASIMKLNGVF